MRSIWGKNQTFSAPQTPPPPPLRLPRPLVVPPLLSSKGNIAFPFLCFGVEPRWLIGGRLLFSSACRGLSPGL